MNVSCDFLANQLICELPEQTMDVMLKVRTKTGEHTFREDIYTCTLKYRRWNNELRPFQSLKRRVANIFQKHNLLSDDSKGTSTQTIVNDVEGVVKDPKETVYTLTGVIFYQKIRKQNIKRLT